MRQLVGEVLRVFEKRALGWGRVQGIRKNGGQPTGGVEEGRLDRQVGQTPPPSETTVKAHSFIPRTASGTGHRATAVRSAHRSLPFPRSKARWLRTWQ